MEIDNSEKRGNRKSLRGIISKFCLSFCFWISKDRCVKDEVCEEGVIYKDEDIVSADSENIGTRSTKEDELINLEEGTTITETINHFGREEFQIIEQASLLKSFILRSFDEQEGVFYPEKELVNKLNELHNCNYNVTEIVKKAFNNIDKNSSIISKIKRIVINNNIKPKLDFSIFVDLEQLDCSNNYSNILELDNLGKLSIIRCEDNNLQEVSIKNCSKLKKVYLWEKELKKVSFNNCLNMQELLTITTFTKYFNFSCF